MKKLVFGILAITAIGLLSCTKSKQDNQNRNKVNLDSASDIHDIDYCEASKLIKEYWDTGTDTTNTKMHMV
jgi:hypothetical protein